MAWSILSATYKVRVSREFGRPSHLNGDAEFIKIILAQKDRDDCIDRLVEIMDDVYSFVHDAEPLNKIESHKRIIAVIAKQTTECSYFIRCYTMNKSFCNAGLYA
jgi:hypothetical protein